MDLQMLCGQPSMGYDMRMGSSLVSWTSATPSTAAAPVEASEPVERSPPRGLDLLVDVAALAEAEGAQKPIVDDDQKPRKKRGRRPTPGMTAEERRLHRLMKNRKTAEISRQRKLEHTRSLQGENDELRRENERLRSALAVLHRRMGERGMHVPPETLVKTENELDDSPTSSSTMTSV